MSYLSFGTFAQAIEEASFLNKTEVVDLLVEGLSSGASDLIHKTDKSKLFNSKINIRYLRDAAYTIEIQKAMCKYFEDNVIGKLSSIHIYQLIDRLKSVIISDDTLGETKEKLLAKANATKLADFLSETFLFAAARNNDFDNDNELPPIVAYNSIWLYGDKIFLNGVEVPLPDKLTPPTEIEQAEYVYIQELLKALANKDKVKQYTLDTLPPRYKQELARHRQYYFDAEAISRKMREIYDNSDEFEILKNDTFEGVIDVASMNYEDGYQKLLTVLSKAVSLTDGKSTMWKLPRWLGSSEKKGICHILVNENRLVWVVENEESI